MATPQDARLWDLIHGERAALAEDLLELTPGQWRHDTLCEGWDVEAVVAHLSAAANTTQWKWMRSMVAALFRSDVHNDRRMRDHRGPTPAETLEGFRASIANTVAPSPHLPAFLGEVVVHAQDIRQSLGMTREPSVDALTHVADFFARRNFTVRSHSMVAGLRLQAEDGPFAWGSGALVTGSTLSLVMSMAGRSPYLQHLHGPGVQEIRSRVAG